MRMMTNHEFLERLRTDVVIAIVRAETAAAAERAALALAEAGVRLVELPLTTPGALEAIARVRAAAPPGTLVGAGTVLTRADVRRVVRAGADFIVTPAVTKALAEARLLRIPALAGAYTPTEVVKARAAGAAAVKLFPAGEGGLAHLKALRDPFPDVPFVPVGGVTAERAAQYLEAGALAVGVGGPLVGDAVRGGSLAALAERAAAFLAVIRR